MKGTVGVHNFYIYYHGLYDYEYDCKESWVSFYFVVFYIFTFFLIEMYMLFMQFILYLPFCCLFLSFAVSRIISMSATSYSSIDSSNYSISDIFRIDCIIYSTLCLFFLAFITDILFGPFSDSRTDLINLRKYPKRYFKSDCLEYLLIQQA